MTTDNLQPSLFDTEPPDSAALVAIALAQPKLSKTQREFNTLTRRIRELRDDLAAWQTHQQRFAERWSGELQPAIEAMRHTELELVRRIDGFLRRPPAGVRLGKSQQRTLSQHLLMLVDLLMVNGDADEAAELETLHDRYSDVSRSDRQAMDSELTQAMLTDILGEDLVATLEGGDSESLLQQAQARLADAEAAEAADRQRRAEARAAKRGKPTAAELAAERKASAAQQAGLSLREIFRKLASALHPDREADPAERERKTVLMKRVNHAYQNQDLLELLSLQIEIEQIDGEHLAALPEQRLRHYNHVLKDQVRTLKDELDALALPLLQEFDLPPTTDPRCLGLLDRQLSERITSVHSLKDLHLDLMASLDHPQRRRQWLERLAAEQRQDEQHAADEVLDLLLGGFGSARSRRRKRRR
ncbi:MAG: hypothetical protein AB7F83_13090 [Lysobacterales bacterium]